MEELPTVEMQLQLVPQTEQSKAAQEPQLPSHFLRDLIYLGTLINIVFSREKERVVRSITDIPIFSFGLHFGHAPG